MVRFRMLLCFEFRFTFSSLSFAGLRFISWRHFRIFRCVVSSLCVRKTRAFLLRMFFVLRRAQMLSFDGIDSLLESNGMHKEIVLGRMPHTELRIRLFFYAFRFNFSIIGSLLVLVFVPRIEFVSTFGDPETMEPTHSLPSMDRVEKTLRIIPSESFGATVCVFLYIRPFNLCF